jgi:putative addiction module killer protein
MPRKRISNRENDEVGKTKAAASVEAPLPFSVRVLEEFSGSCPFDDFLAHVKDRSARARILLRLDRIARTGNLGDHRERISGAVSELRLDQGPGYRIYYVRTGTMILVLIGGGTKSGQQADIAKATVLWERSGLDAERFSREFRGGPS